MDAPPPTAEDSHNSDPQGDHPHGPPNPCTAALADPLFVVDWRDGLTLFPGVTEFEFPGQSADLRAQVYGATVQSYAWDISQAPNVSGTPVLNAYQLMFSWGSNPGTTNVINKIKITATMVGGSQQIQTLTFSLYPDSVPFPGGGSGTWPVVLPPDKLADSQAMLLGEWPAFPFAVSLASGEWVVSHTPPAYNPGVPRTGLSYSSLAAEPEPIFLVHYALDPARTTPPTSVNVRLQFDGVWGTTTQYSTGSYNSGDVMQFSIQVDAGTRPTARYPYTVEITANYTPPVVTTFTDKVIVLNHEQSQFGEGWDFDLTDRLYPQTDGVIVDQGGGRALWFAGTGPSYTTPPGDFSTLVKNGYGSYTRTFKDGTKDNFGSTGLQTSIVDRNGNTTSFNQPGGQLNSMTDANGLVTSFGYTGNCDPVQREKPKPCTMTDPAGRATSFVYNSPGQLTSVTAPDTGVWQFSYDSSSRMNFITNPVGGIVSISYNFAGRVSNVMLGPGGGGQHQITALQMDGLAQPPLGCPPQCPPQFSGPVVLLAEAKARYTDRRLNTHYARLDWFGLGTPTQITDPLGLTDPAGHMTLNHRDSNGSLVLAADRLARSTLAARDNKGNPTRVTHPDLAFETLSYNSFSQVTQHMDELGRLTTLTYDPKGNLTQITQPDPDGTGPLQQPITTMTYDSQGNRTSVTDARNHTTSFNYDTRDRATTITYADDDADPANNPIVTLAYDSASNVTGRKDERGNVWSLTYDAFNRPLTQTDPLNHTTSFGYDALSNLRSVTNPLNQTTTFSYNPTLNRLMSVTDPNGHIWSFSYDFDGNLTGFTDPLNHGRAFAYDVLSRRTTSTTPLGFTTTFQYDAEGEITSVIQPDRDGAGPLPPPITTLTYNSRGWINSVKDPLSHLTTLNYDLVGNRTAIIEPSGGGTTTFQYDPLNRVTRVTDALAHSTDYGYDAVDNLVTVTTALSQVTTTTYDARNRPILVTEPDPDAGGPLNSAVTAYQYDGVGNLTRVTDPLLRVSTIAYDAANRRTSITQPDPDGTGPLGTPIVTFSYDNADRLISLRDPVNNVTTWAYDPAGRLITETDPLGKARVYTYDNANRLTRVTDRLNRARDFVYDNDDRRTQEQWKNMMGMPIRTFTYTYNPDNELTQVTEPDSTYAFSFDNDGRLLTISNAGTPNMPAVTLTDTYDPADNRTNVSDSLGGSIGYSYDAAHRMTQGSMTVSGLPGPQTDFGYDAADRLTSLSRRVPVLGGGLDPTTTSTFTYDNDGRLTGITHRFLAPLASYSYTYNAASELVSETNSDGTFTYTYDNTSQLTGVSATASSGPCAGTPSPCNESFGYDVNGNRTASTGYGLSQTYTTIAGNRLSSDGIYNYTYDDEGNTLTKTRISDSQKTEFTWDHRNRLTQVVLKNAAGAILQQSDYTYDAFNRRIIKSFDDDGPGPHTATVGKTIYDTPDFAADPYADFDGSNLTMRYVYADAVDVLLARRDSTGNVAWYLGDHLGTVRDLASTTGTILDHVSYSSFGKVAAESSPSNGDRFKFSGREYDSALSLYYFRARTYDAATGRFLSADPLGFDAEDGNLYRYVGSAPTLGRDPLGLEAKDPADELKELASQWKGWADLLKEAEKYAKDGKIKIDIKMVPTGSAISGSIAVKTGSLPVGYIYISESVYKTDMDKAVQSLIHEAANVSKHQDYLKLYKQAMKGAITKDDFVKKMAKTEYDIVKDYVLKAYEECKGKSGFGKCAYPDVEMAKDFEDFYKKEFMAAYKKNYEKNYDLLKKFGDAGKELPPQETPP